VARHDPRPLQGLHQGPDPGRLRRQDVADRRAALLAAAPLIERAAERLAPGFEGFNLPQAEQFTAALDIPVICVGGFHTREGMEAAITTGRCDAVSAARAMIADPYLFRNMRDPAPGRPVCGYHNGCIARFGGRAIDCYVEDIRVRRDDMLRREENA
jgi:2,4-dienoyl-CoA reductase-like NADH-dependent reductase (Old Yellow Enzyme family)